jgi:hypothetical protein
MYLVNGPQRSSDKNPQRREYLFAAVAELIL